MGVMCLKNLWLNVKKKKTVSNELQTGETILSFVSLLNDFRREIMVSYSVFEIKKGLSFLFFASSKVECFVTALSVFLTGVC